MKRILFFLACFVFAGCTSTKISKETDGFNSINSEKENQKISELINKMTVREKIGQMLAVVPENFDFNLTQEQIDNGKIPQNLQLSEEMKNNFRKYPAGTIILFAKNIETPEQTKKLISDFKENSKLPLMVAVDEEGGRVARVAKNENFKIENIPPALETLTQAKAEKNSRYIADYLYELGFNADFAPVADVWTNEKNTVIGNRAFSAEPSAAAKMVYASVRGFHKGKIKTAVKHFPGHGDTVLDTHTAAAESTKNWEQLKKCEMIPFKAGIKAGTDMVMIAHICTPNAGTGSLPATLSKTWITDRLRGELGFNGVVITDAMGMKAVSDRYESLEAALMAINAGADIILMPHDFKKVFDGLVELAQTGTLSEERINQSVERILKMKYDRQ